MAVTFSGQCMNNFRTYLTLSTVFAIIISPTIALAQDVGSQSDGDNIAYAGAGIVAFSEYLGSDDIDVSPLPYLSVNNFKGFDVFGTALSYRLIDTGTGEGLGKWSLQAGPKASYQIGRDSDDSPNLIGFEDIGGSIPLGGYIRSTLGPVGLRLDAGQDVIGGHGGFTADASIGTFYRLGNWAIQPSASVSWADSNHNESFFAITDTQAVGSPLTAFDVGSGIYSYSANVVTWIEFNEKYALTFIGTYRKFTGDASDSPILQASDGSTDGFYGAISLSRKFDLSKF